MFSKVLFALLAVSVEGFAPSRPVLLPLADRPPPLASPSRSSTRTRASTRPSNVVMTRCLLMRLRKQALNFHTVAVPVHARHAPERLWRDLSTRANRHFWTMIRLRKDGFSRALLCPRVTAPFRCTWKMTSSKSESGCNQLLSPAGQNNFPSFLHQAYIFLTRGAI